MIAADTSSIIGYLKGQADARIVRLAGAIDAQTLWLPPPVVAELRAGSVGQARLDKLLNDAPMLPLTDGFWDRAGLARRALLARRLKARMLDALIAQCCIDAGVPLITLDSDFRHFEAHCGLRLA
ncbi:MAG: PIN domain-containing protein [Caulobacter sp.]|nr:PIN domain-containing protein [Caulobacter sp.]